MPKFLSTIKDKLQSLPRPWRVFVISFIGYTVLIAGFLLLPLPGPGTLVILFGLAILALEFEWAREAGKQGQQWLEKLAARILIALRIRKPDKTDTEDDS